MGDFTQPQQKFAAAGENCDFVITVNFYQELMCAYYYKNLKSILKNWVVTNLHNMHKNFQKVL